MKIRIQSARGDHEAVVEDPEVGKMVYEKLTGRRVSPLPETYREKLPDTFRELEALWQEGKYGYMAVAGKGDDLRVVREKEVTLADEILFVPPQRGG